MSCVSCTDMILFSSPQDGMSSLMFASQNGHNELVRILISIGGKVDLQSIVSSSVCTDMYSAINMDRQWEMGRCRHSVNMNFWYLCLPVQYQFYIYFLCLNKG